MGTIRGRWHEQKGRLLSESQLDILFSRLGKVHYGPAGKEPGLLRKGWSWGSLGREQGDWRDGLPSHQSSPNVGSLCPVMGSKGSASWAL